MQKSIKVWLYNKQWRIQGREGPGHTGLLPSPLIFRPNWGPKGRDKNLETGPPYSQGLDDRPPPPLSFLLVVPRSFFAPKSHRNACFASHQGTHYVQQKKQYNQSIKPPGELYCLPPLFLLWWWYPQKDATSFFCEIYATICDYKKATRGDWFLPTYFWRFAISICRLKSWWFFWTYLLVSLMVLIYFTDLNSGYPGSRGPFSVYLKWNKPCLRFE